jgi:RHS repeat-associated protein
LQPECWLLRFCKPPSQVYLSKIGRLGFVVMSNKIQKVDDISNETASFTDATGSTDYTYYADGSLKSDANKGISLIEYNYLKLPKRIIKGSTIILNEYDAAGAKLKETIGTQVTDYVGNKIYKNNNLYQIVHGEGRIVNGEYEYNIKDHLGNLRVAFRDSLGIAKITQANSYGIFGEDLSTLSYLKPSWKEDKFKFTGKEELPETGYTDFGARLYDKFVPRFTTIDPLAEISRRFSPYTYANDNPLRFIDPDGMRTQAIEQSNLEWGFSTLTHCDGCEFLGGGDKDKKKKEEKEKNTTIPTIPKPTTKDTDPIVAGGIALSGILLADDATVIGVADDPLIPVILAGTAAYALLTSGLVEKMSREIDRILTKPLGLPGFTYELRVINAGVYVDVRGVPIILNAGDIWKFGQTTDVNRYSKGQLNSMVSGGVKLIPVFFGNQVQIRVMEKYLIYGYFFNHGSLPPGNKIFR